MNFSEKARAMRMKSPLTLREIGEQCNVSESMVSRYISGAAKPPDDVAEKILEVLRNSEQDDDRGIYAAHIDDLRRLIRQQQREKRVLFGVLVFFLAFLLLLYLDATHGIMYNKGPVDKSKNSAEPCSGPGRIVNWEIEKDGILPSA